MDRPSTQLVDDDLRLLLDDLHERHGHDFRDYSMRSVARRVAAHVASEGFGSTAELHECLNADGNWLRRLVAGLTVHFTELFRDPAFFVTLREQVLPLLRTYPYPRIWVAGCSSGEEVFSLAILLHEAGLLERCHIYGTDINEQVLTAARQGTLPLAAMRGYTANYHAAGGQRPFSEYYTAGQSHVELAPFLRQGLTFAQHNLVTDQSFNEFQLILCRNVLIYFNQTLTERVHQLLHDSLCTFGILALGQPETIALSAIESRYQVFNAQASLYRKQG